MNENTSAEQSRSETKPAGGGREEEIAAAPEPQSLAEILGRHEDHPNAALWGLYLG